MGFFDKFKKETTANSIDLDQEAARIAAIYNTYPEFPAMAEDRNVDEWLLSIANGTNKLVPKENMIRNEDHLLPGEVILLDWLNGRASTTDEFPDFFELELGILPLVAAQELVSEDYVAILNDSSALHYWSLEQLNDLLTENGLKECSSKERALRCIKKEFSNAYILNIVAPGMYVLTEKGQRIIEKYAEFIRKTLDTPPTD
ncbi:hypothetical protein [Enterococcus sp. UD-01]|jgi:hypothetical protein|uniref:hypothetical protein n=1 Tax=Enterococcus sp. UD-01 TaxID=3373911 RepID=UPI0038339C10